MPNESMTDTTEELTLPQAAHLLHKDYQWVRSRLFRGELSGRQVAGRWLVDLSSALRMQRESARSRD
jgi:hypothetical protein